MDKEEINKRIQEDPDFIVSTKYGNSLSNFLQKKPDGVDDKSIAKLLNLEDAKEVEALYKEAVEHMKTILDVEE